MIYIFIALIFYTLAILIGASASRTANSNLVAGIINVVAAIVPLAVAIPLMTKKSVSQHRYGLIMAVLGGVCIAFFSMALLKSYSENKVGIVVPIVFGGAIFCSTLLSVIVFKEKVTTIEAVGLAILAIGFGIIIYARATAK